MTPAARLAAAAAILDDLDTQRPVEPQLRAWARSNRYAGSKDRRAIADRVYTCLRRRSSSAARMAGAESGRALVLGSLAVEDGLQADEIAALCTGGYGVSPLSEAEVAALRGPVAYPSDAARLDWPDWLWPEAERGFGVAVDDELDALRRRAPVDLRVNTLKATLAEAQAALAAEGLVADPVALSGTALRLPAGAPVARSAAYRGGLVELQDAASQAAAASAGAEPGETVLDFCAGAGGKSLALAATMRNSGRLIAYDADLARMAPLGARADRAGATIIEITGDLDTLPDRSCDCVLADMPCSGSGSWRRDPAGKWRLDAERLDALCRMQAEILDQAAVFVRPGGRLVTATCSVLPCENEDQAARFTAEHTDFTLEDTLSLHPARDGADGFFGARFRRHKD